MYPLNYTDNFWQFRGIVFADNEQIMNCAVPHVIVCFYALGVYFKLIQE